MGTASRPTAFLFVNKDETSASLSNSKCDKTSAIHRHVQRWRNQRQHEGKRNELRGEDGTTRELARTGWALGPTRPQLSTFSSPSLSLTTPSETATLDSTDGVSTVSVSSDDVEPDLSDEDDRSKTPVHQEVRLVIRANFVEGDCIDPFNSTAVRLDGHVISILQYYIAFSVPTRARYQDQTRTRGTEIQALFSLNQDLPAVKEVVHGCLFNKMHMYALLSATSARMEEVDRVQLRRKHSARYFMHKALRRVRAYLTSKNAQDVDKQTVLDVFFLCVCGWYLQEYDAALTHLKATGHLIDSLDMSNPFDKFIHETVMYNDVFLSIETGTRPIFPLTWDWPTMPPERRSTISHGLSTLQNYRRMGRGFTDPSQNHIFSFEMNTVVLDIVPWIDVAQYTWIFKTAVRSDSEWVCKKGQAVLHRLLSCTPISLENEAACVEKTYEECCRLILIILVSYVTTQMAWRSAPLNIVHLKRALQGNDRDWGSTPLNCMLLWILLSGMFTVEGTPDEQWFLERAVPVAEHLHIQTYDHLHEVMGRYFYSPRLQQGTLRKLLARLGRDDQASLSYTKAPTLNPGHSYRHRFGYNLGSTPGQNLCRKGHWEATSTLSCLAEFVSEDGTFDADQHIRSQV